MVTVSAPPSSELQPNVAHILAWRLGSILIPLAMVIGVDRLSKSWIRSTLWDPPRTLVVVPGWLELTPVMNRGIAFGLLQDTGSLLALVFVVVLGLAAMRRWREVLKAPAPVRMALGLIAGGAIGNLIDRAQHGYVTDFIQVPHIAIFQVFNVADASIVIGTAVLVLSSWRSAPTAGPRARAAS
jgi:signal peptidase II